MDEKNLLICDKESRYANALGENILKRSELAFRVFVFTNMESMFRFSQEREIHVLIIDEAFRDKEREKVKAHQVFVLTKEGCVDLKKEEREIYKFQAADQILDEILEVFYEKTNSRILKVVKKSKQSLLAVYSPIHRIGKTSFALTLGKELARTQKTLYLNLEEYADVGGRFLRTEGRNLGDLLYYMRQEEGNLALRLSTMVAKAEELDYVPPILTSQDLKEVSFEEWKKLLDLILSESNYECVVLDLGESVQGLMGILELCDRIYMPVLEDSISKHKVRQCEEEMRRMGMEGMGEKTYKFTAVMDMPAYARKLIREEK